MKKLSLVQLEKNQLNKREMAVTYAKGLCHCACVCCCEGADPISALNNSSGGSGHSANSSDQATNWYDVFIQW